MSTSIGRLTYRGLALFDADDDGDLEILVNAASNGYELQLYHHNVTTPIWNYAVENDSYFSVGDIDVDGNIEIVVVSQNVARVLSAGGGLLSSAEIDTGKFVSTPLLVDIDGDFECEIITNTVYDGDPDNVDYVPREAARDITVIRVFDNELNTLGDTLSYFARSGHAPGPAVSDLDDDGGPELVFLSGDSALHVVDLGSSMGVAEWPQSYNNAMNTNVYQQPLIGTYEEPVSLFNRVRAIGDAMFCEDVYINPGTDVFISKSDGSSGGVDTQLVEITAFKTFKAKGTETYPVRFVAADSLVESSGNEDWWGIFMPDDSLSSDSTAGYFDHTIVKNAIRGIQTNVGCEINHCSIELCDLIGISIARADTVDIRNTTVRDAELVGVSLLQGTVAVLDTSVLEDMPGYGIEVYSGAKLVARGTSFRECDVGIYVHIGDSLTVAAEIDSCIVEGNDIGIWAYRTSDVNIENCEIDDNATDGIYCLEDAHIQIKDNTITNSAVGVYCYDESAPVIEANKITNHTTAVKADDYANPDLGYEYPNSGNSSGYNSIHNNTFHVANLTQGGGEPTIMAENNYWKGATPDCYPRFGKIIGSVDYIPSLCSDPQPSAPVVFPNDEPATPLAFGLSQNYPNPFNPVTTVRYEVPAPGGVVHIIVYNVKGQHVATLVSAHEAPGHHTVIWDGTNDKGSHVASGVYFVRMAAPGFVQTKKLLLLK